MKQALKMQIISEPPTSKESSELVVNRELDDDSDMNDIKLNFFNTFLIQYVVLLISTI